MFNWGKERAALKREIFNDLRVMEDRKLQAYVQQTTKINPADLKPGQSKIFGPFSFEVRFTRPPTITFGQQPAVTVENSFLVVPYVSSWYLRQGVIAGFYLGVYAITACPSDVKTHNITWRADGRASRYKNYESQDEWTTSYNLSRPAYLELTDNEVDK